MSDAAGDKLGAVISDVRDISRDRDKVSVRDVLEKLGSTSHTGLLVLPALIAATPLSGIPGLTTVCGAIIVLISAQMLVGRDHLWLPDWILRRKVESDDLRNALDKAKPVTGFLDRHSHQRLRIFVRRPGVFFLKLLCVVCGLTMPFLELVPFTGSLMASVVLFLALGLLTHDGLFAAIGLLALAIVIGVLAGVL